MGAFSTIAQGVTIDLSMLNGTSYDEETNIANIQPGGRWKNVYADLDTYGVTVTGGRDGGVGVGGFLLGGGVSFFSGREGFGCDSVLNYEVVLANGTIINANSTHNSDLWKALKGGASNFGIVTRFDMEAVPARTMYHNVRFISAEYADTIVDAVSSFTDHGESLRDDALVTFFSHNATVSPEIYVGMLRVNTQGKTNTSSVFDEIQRLPTIIDVTRYQTMSEVALGSQLSAGARFVLLILHQSARTLMVSRIGFATLTVRNDPELLRQIVDIHAEYVESLKQFLSPEDFNTMMFLQPIPSYLTAIGPQRGGNMLGLDHVEGNLVLWNAGVMLGAEDSASFAKAHALLTAMTAKVKRVSESLGADVEFLYTNYADASQDPIGSYGEENVAFMKEVSAKYDPDGVFQRRVPGGFKVSRVA